MADPFAIEMDDNSTTLEMMGMKGTSVSTKGFLQALRNDIMPDSGILPPGVVWVSRQRKVWLVQRPPETVVIKQTYNVLEEINEDSESESWEIHLPWTAYLVDLDTTYYPESIFLYALEGPIATFNDVVGILPLPNFSSGGKLCMPHRGGVAEQPSNVGEGLDLAYRMCWSSGFNLDLDSCLAWCQGLQEPSIIYSELFDNDAAAILYAWEEIPDEDIEDVVDWPPPLNNNRQILIENIDDLIASGSHFREERTSGDEEGENHRLRVYLKKVLKDAVYVDQARRADWGAQSLQMAFQAAASQAGIYE